VDAVKHVGDVIDREERIGKQIIQVRLDLMPNNVTDLFFAMSAYNTRDLSKFADLRATVYDTDTMRELCSCEFGSPGAAESLITCSLYRLPDYLWRARKIGATCKGSARDYKLISNQLFELGYPRNKSMRSQVPPLLECIRREFMLREPVKATSVTLGLGSAMNVSYAIELFGKHANAEMTVAHIADRSFQRMLVGALVASKEKAIETLKFEFTWKYPGHATEKKLNAKERDPVKLQEENFLDCSCIVFERQALRDIVDYRGPHGVHIVHNGVLDYNGVWVGKVGVGDATGGAVWHSGEFLDNYRKCGRRTMDVTLAKIPQKNTEFYFSLSAPISGDISRYKELTVHILDSDNLGHQLARIQIPQVSPDDTGEAIVTCCMFNEGNGCWGVSGVGSASSGSARDYRPILLCLRAIQEKKYYSMPPQWPHQLPISGDISLLDSDQQLAELVPPPPRLDAPNTKRFGRALSTLSSFEGDVVITSSVETQQFRPRRIREDT